MSTKTELITAIQAVVDASGNGNLRIALGAPGAHVENSIGESQPTGGAWAPEPKTWPAVMEGIGAWLDSKGVGGSPRFMVISTLTASGPVPPTADLVELGAAAVAATLPDASTRPRGTQLVLKDLGFVGNTVVPAGTDKIDGAAAPVVIGMLGALCLYSNGTDGWWSW